MKQHRGWDYATKGDYHRNLDPNWSYTPTYLRKMELIRAKIRQLGHSAHILDAGCGEGVLVEQFRAEGYNIQGIDLNYESDFVQRGSILQMPYASETFQAVLMLDVFEHISFSEQPLALAEIYRITCEGGVLIATIPNLAHWNARFQFVTRGELDRSDNEVNHPGERPLSENKRLLTNAGFTITELKGITLTVPLLYRRVICRRPAAFRWLHDVLEPFACPSLSMLTLFTCRKT